VTFGERRTCKLNVQMGVYGINSFQSTIEIKKQRIENAKRGKSKPPDSPLPDGI
jgi:hypothetical protein